MRWTKGEFAVVDNQALIDVDAVHDFLRTSYWAKGRSKMVVELAMERSLAFGLLHRDRTIGSARVITDFAVVGVIEDVYVLPEFQGQGLGKFLVESLLSHPALGGLELYTASRKARGFYESLGFQALDDPAAYMRLAHD
jgi:GNAT superfamily N-acetyltransferase